MSVVRNLSFEPRTLRNDTESMAFTTEPRTPPHYNRTKPGTITTRWESSKWQHGAPYLYNMIQAAICLLFYGMQFASWVDNQGNNKTKARFIGIDT